MFGSLEDLRMANDSFHYQVTPNEIGAWQVRVYPQEDPAESAEGSQERQKPPSSSILLPPGRDIPTGKCGIDRGGEQKAEHEVVS